MMKTRPPIVAVVLAVCLLHQTVTAQESSSESNSTDNNTTIQRIDQYLSAAVEHGFSGTILIAQDGNVIHNKGYGLAERNSQRPNAIDTVFTVGSVTKQFTAAAILKLQEQGKLNVSDPISRFFDDLPDDKAAITIHQLLTHTSGIGDADVDDFDLIPEAKFFQDIFDRVLLFRPGSRHRYCNAGYSVLGKIIELASEKSYEQFMHDNLFAPAGMKQTGYLIPEWDSQKLAHGYARGVMPMGTMIDRFQNVKQVSWVLKGNGGIQSTSLDLYRWYQALQNGDILSPSSMQALIKPYVAEQEDQSSHYAYGWAIYTTKRKTKLVNHNGGNGIFFHDFFWLPEEDVAIIYFTNAYSRSVDGIGWKLERMLFDKDFQPEPIKENPFLFVFQFIDSHQPNEYTKLRNVIEKDFQNEFRSPDPLNRMGYMILEDNPQWAVKLFEINTQLHPKDGNAWDSLGDGYIANKNQPKAIEALEKAVKLQSPGSQEKLQKLLNKSDQNHE